MSEQDSQVILGPKAHAGEQFIEVFEGDHLLVTELDHRSESRNELLTNGTRIRLTAYGQQGYPGIYRIRFYTAKGSRGLNITVQRSLELTGLSDGSTVSFSVDPQTDELVLRRAR